MGATSTSSMPAGRWHGYFAYSYDLEARQPTRLALEIDGEALRGAGEDGDGRYEIAGSIVPADGTVRWQKRYREQGGAVVAYLGRWDAERGEIAGRWRVVNTEVHGRFALRPGEGEAGEAEVEAAPAELLAQLLQKWQPLCRLDLEAVRFDGERAMLQELLAEPDFVKALGESSAAVALGGGQGPRRELAHNRVRLRREVLPHVFAALDRGIEALGLTAPVHLFCENNGTLNAWVTTTEGREIHVTLTSGAINALDGDELAYVLGHELGHAVLGHLDTLIVGGGAELSGLVQLRRLALSRYQELSADRVGLLSCPDVGKAIRAEFMLHSGVTLRDAIGRPEDLLRAARAAVELGAATGEADAAPAAVEIGEGGLDTHPYGPMRTLATDWFGRSTTFHALRGQKGGEISEAELEAHVQRVVELMNPSVLGQATATADIAEFLVLAGLSVAEATGGASTKEVAAIKRLGSGFGDVLAKVRALPLEVQQVRIVELAEQLTLALPPAKLHRIVEDLTLIAEADGTVSDNEALAIGGIAGLLGVSPTAGEETLVELGAGLD